jgi:hypothetical protein
MGFHINVYSMPRIQDYKHAREIFNSKTVVRGENQSIRRIGDRYEREKWLRQEILDGIEVYTAGYYDTDLVRFYPTHKEITLGSYPSTSTQYFVEYIAGLGLYTFEHKRYVPAPFTRSPMVKNGQIECFLNQSGDKFYMNADDWYKLDYNNQPLNPEQFEKPVKYNFDASQMRDLRKPYRNLLKYIDTLLKLNNEGVEKDNALENQIYAYDGKILDLLVNENNMYLSYYHLVNRTQRSFWNGSHTGGNRYTYKCNIGMVKRYLDKLIKLSNPQVLVEEVKPTNNLTTQ